MFIGCSNNVIMVNLHSCNVKRKHYYNNTLGMFFQLKLIEVLVMVRENVLRTKLSEHFLCYLYTIEVLVMVRDQVLRTKLSEHFLCYLDTIEVLVMLNENVLITTPSKRYFYVIYTRLRFL